MSSRFVHAQNVTGQSDTASFHVESHAYSVVPSSKLVLARCPNTGAANSNNPTSSHLLTNDLNGEVDDIRISHEVVGARACRVGIAAELELDHVIG